MNLGVAGPAFGQSDPMQSHIGDLKFYFQEFEGFCGNRSTMGVQLEILRGAATDCGRMIGRNGIKVKVGHHAGMVDPFVALQSPRARALRARGVRVYRRLVAMLARGNSLEVTILHRVYGYGDRGVRYDLFGEVAPIIEYTPLVVGSARTMASLAARRSEDARAKVWKHSRDTVARMRLDEPVRPPPPDTARVLREALELPKPEPGESSQSFQACLALATTQRTMFIAEAKAQAHGLLKQALRLYMNAAWRVSA